MKLFEFKIIIALFTSLLLFYCSNNNAPTTTEDDSKTIADTDQDGIEDALDNCMDIENEDQLDSDLDNIGDVCDHNENQATNNNEEEENYDAYYEPSINFHLIIHIDPMFKYPEFPFSANGENYNIKLSTENYAERVEGQDVDDRIKTEYENLKEFLLKIKQTAEKYGAHLSIQANPDFMHVYNSDTNKSDLDFSELISKGHTLGTHNHMLVYNDKDQKFYEIPENLQKPNLSPTDKANHEVLKQNNWSVATQEINTAISDDKNRHCDMQIGSYDDYLISFGYQFTGGGLVEKVGYANEFDEFSIGHVLWNVFRPSKNATEKYFEDISNPENYFIIPNHPGMGHENGSDGTHQFISTVPYKQKDFTMAFIEWSAHEQENTGDLVWVTGLSMHPNDLRKYELYKLCTDSSFTSSYYNKNNCKLLAENNSVPNYLEKLDEYLLWLSKNFIGKKTKYQNTIAKFSTDHEIEQEFYSWENLNPDSCMTCFAEGDTYPKSYHYKEMAKILENVGFNSICSNTQEGLDFCFKFSDQNNLGYNDIYVAWSYNETAQIDITKLFSASSIKYKVYDGKGNSSESIEKGLTLSKFPTFIEKISE
jgi:hypothetical protein